jgi:alpha-ribazole phosphatase
VPPTLVYLLRHGEVVLAETRRFIGHLDVPLSPRGERQAHVQAERLRTRCLDGVFTSDLGRAVRTGQIVGAPHGLVPVALPALREMAMGRWEGLTASEIERREPEAFAAWRADVGRFKFPDGESVPDLVTRAGPVFDALVASHAGHAIAVVAHGGTNRAMLCRALGVPLARLLVFGQDYGALTVLARTVDGWRLRRLNEAPGL